MLSDLQHLQRYATTGDAHAFRELVQAHGAMVHATALRVTRDAAAAQDVAQETFLELARKAGGITQSVAAWLHRVAWNRACDAVRRETTRNRIEEAMAESWNTDREATWPEIEPHLDEALNELPQELRDVLVLYFLEGQTQAELARHLGKNQSNVSRRIERGVSAMREALKSRGVICGGGLATLVSARSAQAMPPALAASLGKLSLSGAGLPAAATVSSFSILTTTLITMTSTAKILLVVSAAVSIPLAWWMGNARVSHLPPRTSAVPTQVKRPAVPAPKVPTLPQAKEVAATAPSQAAGPLSQLFKDNGKRLKLSATQLKAYLSKNGRNAESLLAAMRLTGDIAFLQEAAQRFPNDAAVQTEVALRSGVAAERRRAIDAMKALDPENALGDHLSALDHFRNGHIEEAYGDLITAAGKTRFDDHALQAQQSAEEAYLTAGFSPVQAKAAAMIGLQRRQIEPMRELSKQLTNLQQGYTAANDAGSAESVRQMGEALGRQMQSSASYLIDELVGINIENQFLPVSDGGVRQKELQQCVGAIRTLGSSPQWKALMEGNDTAEITLYLDRLKLYGEAAAIQWLMQRQKP